METIQPAVGVGPPANDALRANTKVGPWIVEHEIGRGGMGSVYAVVHETIGKRAALKVMHPHMLASDPRAERMLAEAKVVNQIGHPGIVDIFEIGHLADQRRYIVMERLEGQSLAARVGQGRLPPAQVIHILLGVIDAVVAAHAAGIVHRDLKLENIFLVDNRDDPGAPHVKILDWGIAKDVVHDVRHTDEGTLVGTPEYVSPEQVRGKRATPQSDVYSLGVMAYELFVQEPPFMAETAAEILMMQLRVAPPPASDRWPEIPPALEELLHEMLAKAPEHRPSMTAVAHRLRALQDLFTGAHAAARAVSSPTLRLVPAPRSQEVARGEPPTRRQRWRLGIGVLAMLATTLTFLGAHAGDPPIEGDLDLGLEPVLVTLRSSIASRVEAPPAPIAPKFVPPAIAVRHPVVRVAPARPIDPDGTLEPYR